MSRVVEFQNGRIVIDPAVCNGRPTVRGKRITVQTILKFLGAGDTGADILAEYSMLEPADIRACLLFAGQLMNQRYELVASQAKMMPGPIARCGIMPVPTT